MKRREGFRSNNFKLSFLIVSSRIFLESLFITLQNLTIDEMYQESCVPFFWHPGITCRLNHWWTGCHFGLSISPCILPDVTLMFIWRNNLFWHGRLDWDPTTSAGRYVRENCKPLYVSRPLLVLGPSMLSQCTCTSDWPERGDSSTFQERSRFLQHVPTATAHPSLQVPFRSILCCFFLFPHAFLYMWLFVLSLLKKEQVFLSWSFGLGWEKLFGQIRERILQTVEGKNTALPLTHDFQRGKYHFLKFGIHGHSKNIYQKRTKVFFFRF